MPGQCRSRHLKPEILALMAEAVTGRPLKDDILSVLEAVLAQALWVYRRYQGGCSERRVREAAQILYDVASLKPLKGRASALLAGLSAVALLALNGEPLPPPERLAVAVEASCKGEIEPYQVAELLAPQPGSLRLKAKSLEDALRVALKGYSQSLSRISC